ncbi:tRNA (adenine(22)-N(1))-methyltransferase [Lacticigenium naphthae]|uniref:tRNA (adenine(22)-N(1))-methyltransferase n=1 Tax=Lacticigenium naphthae TaxID=515351 RepID=UPI0004101EBE|nr:tRNA (adenine(22)-N(1))-methyltransferase TrmK [Lacticigenium naphthae]
MESVTLSKRLKKAGEYVPKGAILADIGSDHAYLPINLVQIGHVQKAIAGEVVKGPYEHAHKEVEKRQLLGAIDIRLGDGLEVIKQTDHISAVSICGMGGGLIRDILDRGVKDDRLNGTERLILQPNVGEQLVRRWLVRQGYSIVSEAIVEENAKLYEFIVAEKKPDRPTPDYSERDMKYGVFLRKDCSSLFQKKWKQEIEKLQFVSQQLKKASIPDSSKIEEVERDIAEIKEVLTCQN